MNKNLAHNKDQKKIPKLNPQKKKREEKKRVTSKSKAKWSKRKKKMK